MTISLAKYKSIRDFVPEEALAVIDTSALGTGITESYFELGSDGRLGIIESEARFYERLSKGWRDNFVFPEETIREFNWRTDETMRRWTAWSYNNGMPAVGDALRRLRYVRANFSKNVMQYHSLESHLSPEISKIYLPHITNAMKEVYRVPGVMKSWRRSKKMRSRKEHKENDAVVLAKDIALLYTRPVIEITRDSDRKRLAEEFYSKNYSKKYGFPMPQNPLGILFVYAGRATVISRGLWQSEFELALA